MGAYRKLLLHNEVQSGKGANCLNDITKILYVPSSNRNSSICINQAELELLSNYDFENRIDYADTQLMENSGDSLKQHSLAYAASNLEKTVLQRISNKGQNRCLACMRVFLENEITDDSFIEYKSDIMSPCKGTIWLMNTVDNLLDIYKSQHFSFNSTATHIMRKIDSNRFYENSTFDPHHHGQHDHQHKFIELVIKTFMEIRSVETCRHITIMSQESRIRHSNLKETHRAGQ